MKLEILRFFQVFAVLACGGLASCALRPTSDLLPRAVSIDDKFSPIQAGVAPVAVGATLKHDPHDQGLMWMLTANGSDCSPSCGTLTVGQASTNVTYLPPQFLPIGPTITAEIAA